jgi:hypothetical protein
MPQMGNMPMGNMMAMMNMMAAMTQMMATCSQMMGAPAATPPAAPKQSG